MQRLKLILSGKRLERIKISAKEGLGCYELKQHTPDRLCGLVVRVLACKPRGLGFDSRRYQVFCIAVGLERGTLSLVSRNEELLGEKKAAPV
jgi:hypothetical protein